MAAREFTEKEQSTFKKLVSDFSAISTREKQSADYLSRILQREIDWALDPTLLLDAIDYERILVIPKEKNYVLLYNCMINDHNMINEARAFAAKCGKPLIEISNFYTNKLRYRHKVKTDLGIEEFLGYVRNADTIICNAFHGFCFSVVFKKDVYLFLRNNADFRMQNITSALGVSDRLIEFEERKIPEKTLPIDWNMVYSRLSIHKERSVNFIINSFLSKTPQLFSQESLW